LRDIWPAGGDGSERDKRNGIEGGYKYEKRMKNEK
jgi:hypothetical protein